jgi:hypothetical protein
MGQKLRYVRICTRDLSGIHNWLAQSRIASIFSEFHYLMLAQSCKFGVNCCFIGLTHPAACTRARVPLTCGHVHSPPLLTQFAKKGCLSTGLELGIPLIHLKFHKSVPEKFWRGSQGIRTPPSPHPPPRPPPIGPIHIPSKSSNVRIPNI